MNNLKSKLSVILGCVGTVCLVCGINVYMRQNTAERESEALLQSMQAEAESREQANENLLAPQDVSEGNVPPDISGNTYESPQENLPPAVPNPYAESFAANKDMAGWLKIEGTPIDYPIMWTPGDETYYLYKNFEGKEDQNGSLLLDTDSSLEPLTTNLIIHGHNMKDGDMFGTLTDYTDPDYCKEHNIITLYTKDTERRYEVVAVFRSQVYRKTDTVFKFYKFFQADTREEFDDFYQNIKALSLYDTGVTAQFGDHFITLSTCVYHVERGRFVVVAKEIESGDRYQPLIEQGNNNLH